MGKDYAREALRKLGENNRRAMNDYQEATKNQSFWQKYKRPWLNETLSPSDFGMSSLILLTRAERKGVLHREVELDMTEIGGVQPSKMKSLVSALVGGGHLTFSDMGKLAEKFLGVVEPKCLAMSEYVDSGQDNAFRVSKDYEASYAPVA